MEIPHTAFTPLIYTILLYFANHALVFVTVQENICQHVKVFEVSSAEWVVHIVVHGIES